MAVAVAATAPALVAALVAASPRPAVWLPMSALATLSPACTWNAAEEEVN